ncbi:MAG: M20/M25/M40 family metallo-hydrolase [Gammaproteobacteria bacterium]
MQARYLAGIFSLWVGFSVVLPAQAQDYSHHSLQLEVDPATNTLHVRDSIVVPAALRHDGLEFAINARAQLQVSGETLQRLPSDGKAQFLGINGTSLETATRVNLVRYRINAMPSNGRLVLEYRMRLDYEVSAQEEEYARGFRETPGRVAAEGVYLAGTTFWYPYFNNDLVTFELSTNVPDGWQLLSQGSGTANNGGLAQWQSPQPVDEIYLVGGPLVRYQQQHGNVSALVFLHDAEPALAQRYLEATGRYLTMYEELIAPYPYDKFALVENFWETGYGMPSFTLLGPTIIRFPFILTSSYPHEILHNWWGNSVFVDYQTGNWCEGLTAYLADHLLQEQRGAGAEFRRNTLQRFRNFVREDRDFPLQEFRSRHSAVTEAVGYGKTLMGFHMLRRQLGDAAFIAGLRRFYADGRGTKASFADLRRAMELISERDLETFFRVWTEETGAPLLTVSKTRVKRKRDGYEITGQLAQQLGGTPYPLTVPVVVQTATGTTQHIVKLDRNRARFSLRSDEQPLALSIDPHFDLFRLLYAQETPASIGQVFGEPQVLAVLSAGDENQAEDYRAMLAGWQSDAHQIEMVTDTELDALPSDRSIWLLGTNNRFLDEIAAATESGSTNLAGTSLNQGEHSWVSIRRHPNTLEHVVGWIVLTENSGPAIQNKLPHYGKYSYLGFEGAAGENIHKGQWPTSDSPLYVDLRQDKTTTLPPLEVDAPPPLVALPSEFSAAATLKHAVYLSDPAREGRGIGTQGLADARDYIEAQFVRLGLAPGFGTSYQQALKLPSGPDGRPATVQNVVGVVEGSSQDLPAVLVSAHYDHLGYGWPSARVNFQGQIHPGADDNASGVAVLLTLAEQFKNRKPLRNIVFAAFSAEEAGLIGARYFAANVPASAGAGIHSVVNLDTVGRLGTGPITFFGTGSATEWPHIFRGVGFETGIDSKSVAEGAEGSDQLAFLEQNIPAVQVFAQAHGDYHKPSDTADKLDAAGMIKIARFVTETVKYLADRQEPLTSTLSGDGTAPLPATAPSARRVSLGTVPDFGFPGPGIRVDDVVPQSAAATAGLKAGDVLLAIDDQPVEDLRGYSELLKTLVPQQSVEIKLQRGDEQLTVDAILESR